MWVVVGVICSLILTISSHTTAEARPAVRMSTTTRAESALAFTELELALHRVLRQIACRELTAAELGTQFLTNSSVTREVKAILKSIDLPSDYGDGVPFKRPCATAEPPTEQLYFLDFRSASDPECVAGSLPRLRLIDSAVPVFPAYYMDWECGYGCSSNYTKVANYELLQKTGTCCDGTADWTTVEATYTYPLTVSRACTSTNRNV